MWGIVTPDYRLACEHGSEKSIAGIAARNAVDRLDDLRAGCGDHVFVLFAFERTGGVNQKAVRRELRKSVAQDGDLALLESGEIFGLQLPFDFGIAGQRAGAGTGGVDQDAIEWAAERQRMAGVEHDDGNVERRERSGAAGVKFGGDGANRGFDGLRRFVAGRGAEIEKSVSGLELQQGDNSLRGNVLEAERLRIALRQSIAAGDIGGFRAFRRFGIPHANVAFGNGETRARDALRGFDAILRCPAVQQPGRRGERFGNLDRLPQETGAEWR